MKRPENAARLSAAEVERLHSAIGGDPVTEAMIVRFIADRYGARSLMFLPRNVAAQILRRPGDFIRAAKDHSLPEFSF